jgi:hypothetical protein
MFIITYFFSFSNHYLTVTDQRYCFVTVHAQPNVIAAKAAIPKLLQRMLPTYPAVGFRVKPGMTLFLLNDRFGREQ